MNKNDWKLILVVLSIVIIFLLISFSNKKNSEQALVYYKDDLIKTIDLNFNDKYIVTGENGEVIIEVLNKQIRVIKETSPYHLCSKQGFIKNSGQSLICLPNKIIITIDGQKIDTVVR